MCLHQILHYCVKAGWLVIFIPGGESDGGQYLVWVISPPSLPSPLSPPSLPPLPSLFPSPPSLPSLLLSVWPVFLWTQSGKEVRPSTHLPGTYDQPEAAATWLKTFRTLNSHFTSQVTASLPLFPHLTPSPPPPLYPSLPLSTPLLSLPQLHLSRDWEWSKKEHSSAGEEVNKVIDKVIVSLESRNLMNYS